MKSFFKYLAISVTLSQAAYAAVPNDPLAAKVQEVNLVNSEEPTTLDPQLCHETACTELVRSLYEGLLSTDGNGEIVPAAAEKWSITPDGKKYTFALRKNLKWSDGSELTAHDFVYGFRRLVDPKVASENASNLENVVNGTEINQGKMALHTLGVKALDNLTLEITLKKPSGYFLESLAVSAVVPLQKKNYEKYGASAFTLTENFVGNGPFILSLRKSRDRIVFTPNKYYWNKDKVYLSKVNYLIVGEAVAEYKMFEANQIHMTNSIPTEQIKGIREKYPNQLKTFEELASYYYIYNLRNPKLKNKSLRQALNIAIDRDVITKSLLNAGQIPAYDFIPNKMKSYKQNKAYWQEWPRDKQLSEARKLYAEAGYTKEKPLKIQILFNTDEGHKKIATAIASMWKKSLGAEVEILNEEWKTMLDKRSTGQFEVLRMGGVANINDPYNFFENLISYKDINTAKFQNPEFDKYIEQAENEVNPEKRKALLHKAGKIIVEEAPYSPIYYYVNNYLIRDEVVGIKKNSMNQFSLVGVYLREQKKS